MKNQPNFETNKVPYLNKDLWLIFEILFIRLRSKRNYVLRKNGLGINEDI